MEEISYQRTVMRNFFRVLDGLIEIIFAYRVYSWKLYGKKIGLTGYDLESHIFKIFEQYPVYDFIEKIISDVKLISSRSYVKGLPPGIERQKIIANIFLVEFSGKYSPIQISLFSTFETIKGIAHVDGKEHEDICNSRAEIVANFITPCIGCNYLPSKRCSICNQIVYCGKEKCLAVSHCR